MVHHFILLRLNPFDLSLGLIGRDGGLSTLCHGCGFACHQRVLKTFLGPGYLCSEDSSLTMAFTGKFVYIFLALFDLDDDTGLKGRKVLV